MDEHDAPTLTAQAILALSDARIQVRLRYLRTDGQLTPEGAAILRPIEEAQAALDLLEITDGACETIRKKARITGWWRRRMREHQQQFGALPEVPAA